MVFEMLQPNRTCLHTSQSIISFREFVFWVVKGVRLVAKSGLADDVKCYFAHCESYSELPVDVCDIEQVHTPFVHEQLLAIFRGFLRINFFVKDFNQPVMVNLVDITTRNGEEVTLRWVHNTYHFLEIKIAISDLSYVVKAARTELTGHKIWNRKCRIHCFAHLLMVVAAHSQQTISCNCCQNIAHEGRLEVADVDLGVGTLEYFQIQTTYPRIIDPITH